MHMADALLSPVVSGTMTIAASTAVYFSYKKVSKTLDEVHLPLMGVMGAFVFAAQMINFTIPGTGSSGHLGGGMLLAALLGPYAGFLSMMSVLLIQAIFFGDGGLMALGANIINLGFFTCFVVYPLIYKPMMRRGKPIIYRAIITVFSAMTAMSLGAFAVVIETVLSGRTELPFFEFMILMIPIHLAIGVVEGLVTFFVLEFVYQQRPGMLQNEEMIKEGIPKKQLRKGAIIGLIISVLLIGSVISLYASELPDGLEWSIENIVGSTDLESQSGLHQWFSSFQEKITLLPDYNFKENSQLNSSLNGTSFSGIVGGILTLSLLLLFGFILRKAKGKSGHEY
ncbi:energy-coupling factor ABC transporter permease [Fusibacter bizertensis]|uniref:Energy-coupling factor ABC transporter permease n=1 Tax=Fusibacter bizertensis TaxID=1488331 RepID=A0ABT6NBT4_9FIRM|nr:energy-coupling factor ABC transporter permease [Fusibacter bizertensis]MDH8677864.1 energy-coupling factor ABC transporter permease [Fusibacter bizertensis]